MHHTVAFSLGFDVFFLSVVKKKKQKQNVKPNRKQVRVNEIQTLSVKKTQALVQMHVAYAIHYNGNRFKARDTYTLKYYSLLNRFKLFCNR